MATYIDRRLTKKIDSAGEVGQVDAILVVKDDGDSGLSVDDGGLARRVIEGASERTGVLPNAVRYFPRANAAVISASSRLVQEILKDANLAVASATDFDLMDFF